MNVANTEKIVKVRAHVIVAGLVQGVFFRSETRRVANARGSPAGFGTCRMIGLKQCLKMKKST